MMLASLNGLKNAFATPISNNRHETVWGQKNQETI